MSKTVSCFLTHTMIILPSKVDVTKYAWLRMCAMSKFVIPEHRTNTNDRPRTITILDLFPTQNCDCTKIQPECLSPQ